MNEFREVTHNNCKCYVNKYGIVKVKDKEGNFQPKKWRYNKDGYIVVSLCGINSDGKKIYRSVGVHILVAKAWVLNDDIKNKKEVNHKDFNRANPYFENLEWVSHKDNVIYSRKAGRYPSVKGELNPNYKNNVLHLKYSQDKEYAKIKQSRKGSQNGRAKKCKLYHKDFGFIKEFSFLKESVLWMIENKHISYVKNLEGIIQKMKKDNYKGYYLKII